MSEKLKHTPGPWRYEVEKKNSNEFNIIFNDCYFVATTWNGVEGLQNSESNARLISVAPDMLEILIKQYKWLIATQQIYNPVEMLFVISEVREIIEKATGLKIEEIIN